MMPWLPYALLMFLGFTMVLGFIVSQILQASRRATKRLDND